MESFFAVMADASFTIWERVALGGVLAVAVIGLLYAAFLAAEVLGKDQGTEAMKKISGIKVADVTIEEPTLEEIFMHYYE